jgi:hypothetical protein
MQVLTDIDNLTILVLQGRTVEDKGSTAVVQVWVKGMRPHKASYDIENLSTQHHVRGLISLKAPGVRTLFV